MEARQVQTIIDTDHHLEEASEHAGLALAKHRWHWTLDESNPDRYPSVRAYALDVGRTQPVIYQYVKAYEIYLDKSNRAEPITFINFSECLERAQASEARQAVIEAVAQAREQTFTTTRRLHKADVQQVRAMREEYVEQHPEATPEETQAEVQRAAKFIVGLEKARERSKDPEVTMPKSLVSVVIVADLIDALAKLRAAAQQAKRLDLDDEDERDIVTSIDTVIGTIEAVIAQIKRLVHGEASGHEPKDWDTGLANLGKEE